MLERLCNCECADWEDRLGPALTAVHNNVSEVTGFAPFMLHHCRPARHTIGRMLDGTSHPSWGNRLQLQAEIMQKASQATAASRGRNRARLESKANTKLLEVGDQVMVRGQRLTPLTSKWDHHYQVISIRGKVITVLHIPTGKMARHNRNKIRLVDSEVAWEGVGVRPKAQQTNLSLVAEPQLLPQKEPRGEKTVAPLVIKRLHYVTQGQKQPCTSREEEDMECGGCCSLQHKD